MAATAKQAILNSAYYLLEKSDELWDTDSSEYATARGLANVAIGRWERYDNTKWKDLLTKYSDASGVTTTLTAGTYTYNAPSDTLFAPVSHVRTTNNGAITTWHVIPAKDRLLYTTDAKICWFTGSQKAGFVLNFNSGVTLTTGDTIDYDYIKKATRFAAITDTTQCPDPDFISYYIAAHMAEEGIDPDLYNMAEERLEQMRVVNMAQLAGVSENTPFSTDFNAGFGS